MGTRVLENLTLSLNWIGRRIPTTLGMKLSNNPIEKKQFEALFHDNLPLGQPVVSTSGNMKNPEYVVDGLITPESYWSTASQPSSLKIDLGDVHTITRIRVFSKRFAQEGDVFKYVLNLSVAERGIVHRIVRDETSDITELCHDYPVEPTAVRYLNLKILLHNGETPINIREIEVY